MAPNARSSPRTSPASATLPQLQPGRGVEPVAAADADAANDDDATPPPQAALKSAGQPLQSASQLGSALTQRRGELERLRKLEAAKGRAEAALRSVLSINSGLHARLAQVHAAQAPSLTLIPDPNPSREAQTLSLWMPPRCRRRRRTRWRRAPFSQGRQSDERTSNGAVLGRSGAVHAVEGRAGQRAQEKFSQRCEHSPQP